MIRFVERIRGELGAASVHAGSFSVRNEAQLNTKFLECCDDLAHIVQSRAADSQSPPLVWIWLKPSGIGAKEKFALAGIRVRIDTPTSERFVHYDFVTITVTLLNPASFGLQGAGPDAVLSLVSNAFIRQWQNLIVRSKDADQRRALAKARLWGVQQPSDLLTFDESGRPVTLGIALQEPEEAFEDYWLKLGLQPPNDDEKEDAPG